MKLIYVAVVIFLFSFQTHANLACRIMFNLGPQVSTLESIENLIREDIQSKAFKFQQLYQMLQRVQLRSQGNEIFSAITETNNEILDQTTWLQTQKMKFSSRSERERFKTLMDSLKGLFLSQGFPSEMVDQFFEIRLRVAAELEKEEQRPRGPIGFLTLKKNTQAHKQPQNTVRKMGFFQTPLQAQPYGREKIIESEFSFEKQLALMQEEIQRYMQSMPSIGFLNPNLPVDVGYTYSSDFDVQTGFFILVKNQGQPAGFLPAK